MQNKEYIMKKIVLSLFVIIAMTSLQANAFDFMSALKFWDRASETQQAQAVTSLEDIQKQMTAIDSSVQTAFLNIVSELSTRKETKAVKSDLKAKSLADVISSYTTTLASNKDAFVKKMTKLSDKEKTALVNNLSTLSESAQQYLLLATNGAKAATNTLKTTQKLSEFATTVSNINNIAGQLKNRATTLLDLTSQATALAKSAGLTVQ